MEILIRRLRRTDYDDAYEAMQRFNAARTPATADELWLTEHPPVYTAGVSARPQHFPRGDSSIPLRKIDRGGQITYHGPGQAIAYVLLDLARRDLKIRELVGLLEQAVIDMLAAYNVSAERRAGAPGVYVCGAKIAALGLRVRRGACYHGVALNVAMDLAPFQAIDPCGYPGLAVTDCRTLGVAESFDSVSDRLGQAIAAGLADAKGAFDLAGAPIFESAAGGGKAP
jgi:lipoyl(octanoyl) transferase